MKVLWNTRWQGQDIAVFRNDVEVDRVDTRQIERVFLLHRGSGDTPGDVTQVLVEQVDDCLLFSAETGFASRVNFERQAFWAERNCVHWVSHNRAPLPLRLRTGNGLFRLSPPAFARVPKAEVAALMARWPVQGPQTWEERKRCRIERAQAFSLEHA
ncbi:MAG: hypothetical protein M3Y67_06140 [Pseudomonadota bacterium]|nr:hypothetical protein [Pseudomonadota bacterium]